MTRSLTRPPTSRTLLEGRTDFLVFVVVFRLVFLGIGLEGTRLARSLVEKLTRGFLAPEF